MKKSKFTGQQIVFALKQAETGVPVAEVCRRMGISEATFYNWRKKFSGLGTNSVVCGSSRTRMRDSNSSSPICPLDKQMLQDVLKKKF